MRLSRAFEQGLVALGMMAVMGAHGQEPATAPVTHALRCDQPVFQFGEVDPGQVISHSFVLVNPGSAPVRIINVRTSCGCTTAAMATNLLAPGQSTELVAGLDLKGRTGTQRKALYVESDDPVSPRLRLEMSGTVVTPIEVQPAGVHFGTLAREGVAEQDVLLVGRTGVVFQVKEVRSSSAAFTADVETKEAGHLYRVTIRSTGPRLAGTSHAAVQVLTDHPLLPRIDIPVSVFVSADVVATPSSLLLVQGATNAVRAYYVGVHSPAGKPFRVIKAEAPAAGLTCMVATVAPDRYRIEVKAAGDLTGVNGESLRIETDVETMKELRVPLRVIAGPGAAVPPSP